MSAGPAPTGGQRPDRWLLTREAIAQLGQPDSVARILEGSDTAKEGQLA